MILEGTSNSEMTVLLKQICMLEISNLKIVLEVSEISNELYLTFKTFS